MKRFISVLFATMLIGHTWASNYNEWFADGGATNANTFSVEQGVAKIVVSKAGATDNQWQVQLCNILSYYNKMGEKFKLSFEIKYEGSLGEGASFTLLTGKNLINPCSDYNTEVVDVEGANSTCINKTFAVGKEWTKISVEGTIGEQGANSIGLELNFGGNAANEGIFRIRNIMIGMGSSFLAYYVNGFNMRGRSPKDGTTITGFYDLNATTVNIPEYIEYEGTQYPTTYIEASLFANCCNLTSVNIPSSVTNILGGTFYGCSSLTSINIPNGVTSIGNNAFCGCSSLTSINIPNGVTSIGEGAFEGCNSLTSIIIPNGVTSIGKNAFCGCSSLTSVNIPNSIASIGSNPFANCSKLSTISVENGNKNYKSINGVLFNYDETDIVCYPNGKTGTTYSIPNSVTNIDYAAFCGCNGLTTVTIPNSVTSIGEYAFCDCNSLTSIIIPNSVTSISHSAFSGCDNIEILTYNTNAIGSIFSGKTSLKTVNIGDSITNICNSAFKGCRNLKHVTISNSVTSVGDQAFLDCDSLTSITIPNSVTSISYNAFNGCNIETLTYNTNAIGSIFRSKNSLKNINIGDSVTIIANSAFQDCKNLKHVNISHSVTNIGDYAFLGCDSLPSIIIPNSVTSIGDYAFKNCNSLTSVSISESVTNIGNNTFENCRKLTSIMIPNSVTGIGDYSFNNCDGLTLVYIPNTMTNIGNYAFCDCPNITQISIPNSVTSIGKYTFNGCYGLTTVSIPNSVTAIGSSAFKDCINLTIYCQAKIKHSGWHNDWNISGCPVEWGANLKSVTVNADNNEHGSVYGSGVYIDGLAITITAAPAAGYHFDSWSDGNTDNPRTINVGEDITITANFAASLYTITIYAENGSVTGHAGSFAYGAEVTLTAEPAKGYRFVSWSDGNTDNPRTFIVRDDLVLTAVFDVGENLDGNSTAVAESIANAVSIYTRDNVIVVENATDEISVYDAMGRMICRDVACRVRTEIRVNTAGIYIVRVGNVAKRVMINE